MSFYIIFENNTQSCIYKLYNYVIITVVKLGSLIKRLLKSKHFQPKSHHHHQGSESSCLHKVYYFKLLLKFFFPGNKLAIIMLKGYSSGQTHFSEIHAKLAGENEFVTHFVQNCLETHENEQNVVLNECLEALGNRSEIVQIFVLAMTTADDGVGRSNSV